MSENENELKTILEELQIDESLPEYQPETKHRLFVYGTLKRGFGNNPLLSRATFLTPAQTADNSFMMFDFGGVPGVRELSEGGEYAIFGEIYEIDGIDLLNCDILENNGHIYKRKLFNLAGQEDPAWMYALQLDPYRIGFSYDGVRALKMQGQENKALVWLGKYAEQFDNEQGEN
jgi:gamma-glutamylaminecyclotransferase